MTSVRVKADIYKAFVANKQKPLNFSEKALKSIINTLRTAFVDQQSTSLMINGSNHEALALILQAQQIMFHESRKEWVLEGVEQRSLIGRISGALNDSDAAAFLSLADQFCLRMNQDRNMNAMLEDLGVFFSRCKEDGTPALIVIEDFHLFAHQKRQTLIYTLLDLLHRADYLFAVIGVSERLDAFSQLEKRVVSRMYSQLLSVPFPTPEEICAEMHWLLTVKPNDPTADSADDSGSRIMTEKEALLQMYNASVESVFGAFHLVPIAIVQHKWARNDSIRREELLHEEQRVLTTAHQQEQDQQQTLPVHKTEDTAMDIALEPSTDEKSNNNNDGSSSKRRKGSTGEVLELLRSQEATDNDTEENTKDDHRHKHHNEQTDRKDHQSAAAINYNFFSLQPRPQSSSAPSTGTNHIISSGSTGQVNINSHPMPVQALSSSTKAPGASNLANKLVAAAVSARAEALSGGNGGSSGARVASVRNSTAGSGPIGPLAHKDIALHLSFGRRRRFFQKAALHVLTLLDPAQPVLTLSLWRRACEMNEPPSLPHLLSALTAAELALYSVIARKQTQDLALLVSRQLAAAELVQDFDRLTNWLQPTQHQASNSSTSAGSLNKPSSYNSMTHHSSHSGSNSGGLAQIVQLLQRLQALGLVSCWQGLPSQSTPSSSSGGRGTGGGHSVSLLAATQQSAGALLGSLVVTVEHSAREIHAAFSLESDRSLFWRQASYLGISSSEQDTEGSSGEVSAVIGIPRLVMAPRVRNAVLQPHAPLLYQAQTTSSSTIASSSAVSVAANMSINSGHTHRILQQQQHSATTTTASTVPAAVVSSVVPGTLQTSNVEAAVAPIPISSEDRPDSEQLNHINRNENNIEPSTAAAAGSDKIGSHGSTATAGGVWRSAQTMSIGAGVTMHVQPANLPSSVPETVTAAAAARLAAGQTRQPLVLSTNPLHTSRSAPHH